MVGIMKFSDFSIIFSCKSGDGRLDSVGINCTFT